MLGGSSFDRFATTSNHLSRSTIDVYAYMFGSISVEKSPAGLLGSQRQRHSMNVPVAPIVHVVRLNVLENEAVWRLGPNALEREETRSVGQTVTAWFSYRDVRELRLSFAPTSFDSARYQCDLQLKHGTIRLVSTHYVGVGDFEDRAESYGPLVRGLVTCVAAAKMLC